jgi:biotin carboxyl carrier protein
MVLTLKLFQVTGASVDSLEASSLSLPLNCMSSASGASILTIVSPGDTIEEDDVLAEVQNDKSVVEIPSPVSGTIEEVLVDLSF